MDDDFPILLTARATDDHFRLDIDDSTAWLSCTSLQALVKIACARLETDSGLVHIGCLTICRLRQTLDKVQPGLGKRLIATGFREEYYLTIPKSQFRKRVAVAACFFDLVRLKLVTPQQAEVLRKGCRKGKLREEEVPRMRKSRRKRRETKRKPSGN